MLLQSLTKERVHLHIVFDLAGALGAAEACLTGEEETSWTIVKRERVNTPYPKSIKSIDVQVFPILV